MPRSTYVATLALSLFAGTGLFACSSADPQEIQSAGTVSLPLTAVGSSGARYHLKAMFNVTGEALVQPIVLGTSSDPSETELTASLDAGSYKIELNNGWQLFREDGAGQSAVDATLESAVAQPFTIKSKVTTTVTYRFKVNGQVVETGPGTLSVGITVSDIAGGYYEFGLGHGYAWFATDEAGTTVSSNDFASITTNGPFCIKGEVIASPEYIGFAMVGINLNQSRENSEPAGLLLPPPGSIVHYGITNDLTSPMRVQLLGADGETNGNARWCVDLPLDATVSGAIALEEFSTECWFPGAGTPYRGEPLESIAVLVPGSSTMQTPYSFCVNTLGIK
jgi:hypothetical protein